ncbi:MAG: hypothetical protein Q3993_00985 [Filifactor alocis]|nr:hypothetical protein [Filifactor alocis]
MENLDFLVQKYSFMRLKGQAYAGRIKEFLVIVQRVETTNYADIHIGACRGEGDTEFGDKLRRRLQGYKVGVLTREAYATIRFKLSFSKRGTAKRFEELIEEIILILETEGYKSGSFLSGESDSTLKLVRKGRQYFYISQDEIPLMKQRIENDVESAQGRREDVAKGLFGVVSVAILGLLAYILVGTLDYYTFFVPIVLLFVSYEVYKKLAGRISAKSLVMIFAILCVSMYISTFLEYSIRFYNVLKLDYDTNYLEVLSETSSIIREDRQIKGTFLADLIINALALFLSSIFILVSSYRSEFRGQKAEEIR